MVLIAWQSVVNQAWIQTYVHRSGRTARANKDGIAVMLISPQDQKNFMKIFTVLKKGLPL